MLVGTQDEADVFSAISALCPGVKQLLGQTSFAELAALGREAACAIGNDTGPMHLIAYSGCPSLMLFSQASLPPEQCAPRIANCRALFEPQLCDLSPEAVIAQLSKFIQVGG